jgi:4-diphosphocytidyl-2-C-methyl-D-erythritol kinase
VTAAGPVRMRTNAKVNLFLQVLGDRGDGYHEIQTILHGVALADDMTITPTTSRRVDVDLRFSEGMVGRAPAADENLVLIAANRLIELGARNEGLHIAVTKRIPIGAGLGGGSGNAAGALVALNDLWGTGIDDPGLLEIAAQLGSDVPYCIDGGTVLATRRGDVLTKLPGPNDFWFVLGISWEPLSTRAVYEAWDDSPRTTDADPAPMTLALGAGDLFEVALLVHNDLEPAAFGLRPELEEKKVRMKEEGALAASLSGSGPTLFALAQGEDHAGEIAGRVEGDFDRVLVVRSAPACIEFLR